MIKALHWQMLKQVQHDAILTKILTFVLLKTKCRPIT